MDVLEYYIDLRQVPEFQHAKEILISKGEIASILFCSSRNVHLILNRWIEEGYVQWKSQRGRGKKSTLTFLTSIDEAALLHVQKLIQKEKVKEAMDFATQNSFSNELKEKLVSIIRQSFGIQHVEHQGESHDILHIPLQHRLSNMNPFFVTIATEAHILNDVFDSLVRYNVETKTVEPHLTHGWEANEDYSTWTFYLRKGVRFHNGSLLTSEDVKWTFQSILDESSDIPNKWLLEDIRDMSIENMYTISFHLNDGNRLFPNFLSAVFTSIIPVGSDIKDSFLSGTGPFMLEHVNDEKIVLRAFDNHFQGRPFLDQVSMWKLPEGDFNPLYFFIHDDMGKYEADGTRFTIHDNGSNYLIFNMNKSGVHQDPYFKRAVSEMIDSCEMIQDLGSPRAAPSTSFIPERSFYKNVRHSTEKAKELLAKSDYAGETLHMSALRFEDFLEDANWMKQKLSEIGIKVEIHSIELSDIYHEDYMLSFDAIYSGEGFEDNLELGLFTSLRNEYGIRRFLNASQLEELDEGFESMKKQPDYESRIQAFQAIEEQLKEDGAIIFTVHASDENTFHSNLQGIQISGYGWPVFRELWIKKE